MRSLVFFILAAVSFNLFAGELIYEYVADDNNCEIRIEKIGDVTVNVYVKNNEKDEVSSFGFPAQFLNEKSKLKSGSLEIDRFSGEYNSKSKVFFVKNTQWFPWETTLLELGTNSDFTKVTYAQIWERFFGIGNSYVVCKTK